MLNFGDNEISGIGSMAVTNPTTPGESLLIDTTGTNYDDQLETGSGFSGEAGEK